MKKFKIINLGYKCQNKTMGQITKQSLESVKIKV